MDASTARRLFDANAETYDRVNSLISLGLDARWREWVAEQAVVRPGDLVLDAFAGTGRVGLRAAALGAHVTLADVSPGMLAVARRRAASQGLHAETIVTDLTAETIVPGDLGGPFDAITLMWGLRYLDAPAEVLRGLSQTLAPRGRIVIVDFVEPSRGVLSRLAAVYFFRVLPWIAGTLAGQRELYRELVTTTRAMGPKEHLLTVVHDAGLAVSEEHVMGFGLVVGIVAVRPQHHQS